MIGRAFLCLCAIAGSAEAAGRQEQLLFAQCRKQAGEYTGHYRGRVLLHREFLAAMGEPEPAAIERSIDQQLHYLWGHYRNDADAHASMQIALSSEAPEIRILSRTVQPYGRDLPLPYDTHEARLAIDDPYTKSAARRGRVKASDPALLIEYEIRFRIAACGRNADPPATARVPLPADPWLAYWYVAKTNHRPLRYHQDRAVTTPCADDDFADLPHPYYYWYDWLPTRHGPDDEGHDFDCRTWLHAGDQYDDVDVAFSRVSAPSLDFGRLRKELGTGQLTATILVGVTDHAVTDLQLPRWRKGLENGKDLTANARALLREMPIKDGGTRSFLGLLGELDGVMKVQSHSTTIEDGYLRTTVHGRLAESHRAIRVGFWLGLTDVFGPVPPRHFSILHHAITEDQIVVYWGHSGIGENFRLSQIESHVGLTHAQMSAELARAPLRLVAFLSCYSYMYFGRDLLAASTEREGGTYFVFTGMEQAQHEAGPLGVLDLVDRVLGPDGTSGRLAGLPRLAADEFWLVKEVEKAK